MKDWIYVGKRNGPRLQFWHDWSMVVLEKVKVLNCFEHFEIHTTWDFPGYFGDL